MTEITGDKKTGKITIKKQEITLELTAEDSPNLYTLFTLVGWNAYKNWLKKKQRSKCADCGVKEDKLILHHDPPLGLKGSQYIDYEGKTRNRLVCKDCHEEAHKK